MRKLCAFEANWSEKKAEFEIDNLNLKWFLAIKTQRNARKLLIEAKFESYYLFQARGTHFKLKNMEFLHEQ